MNVSLKVVDRNQWLIERKGQSLGEADADEQRSGQSGALRDRDGIDGIVSMSGFRQCLANHRHNRPQVLARCKFGDDSTVRLMGGDLRSNDVGENLFARAHHGSACFVTGAFDA